MDGLRHIFLTILVEDMMTLCQAQRDHVIGLVTGVLSIDLGMHLLFSLPHRQLVQLIQIMGG